MFRRAAWRLGRTCLVGGRAVGWTGRDPRQRCRAVARTGHMKARAKGQDAAAPLYFFYSAFDLGAHNEQEPTTSLILTQPLVAPQAVRGDADAATSS